MTGQGGSDPGFRSSPQAAGDRGASLNAPPTRAAPPIPGAGALPGAGGGERGSSMALGALVCGLIGLVLPPVALVALVLAIIALTQLGRSANRGATIGMAVSGLICAAAGMVITPAVFIMLYLAQSDAPTVTSSAVVSSGPAWPTAITKNYYLDLNTNELFADEAVVIPPIAAPSRSRAKVRISGQKDPVEVDAGVKAYVFACGDCADEAKRFIGYLEMYTPEAQKGLQDAQDKARAKADPTSPEAMLMYEEGLIRGRMIRLPYADDGSEPQWVPSESEQGVGIIMMLSKKCPPGARLKPCYPPQ